MIWYDFGLTCVRNSGLPWIGRDSASFFDNAKQTMSAPTEPSAQGSAQNGFAVFLSHAGEDLGIAKLIAGELERRNVSTFVDVDAIAAGDDFEESIISAIGAAREVVVLLTPNALKRMYVWMEVGVALSNGKPLIGILHDLSPREVQSNPDIITAVKKINLVPLEELGKYLDEVQQRMNTRE